MALLSRDLTYPWTFLLLNHPQAKPLPHYPLVIVARLSGIDGEENQRLVSSVDHPMGTSRRDVGHNMFPYRKRPFLFFVLEKEKTGSRKHEIDFGTTRITVVMAFGHEVLIPHLPGIKDSGGPHKLTYLFGDTFHFVDFIN